MCTYDQLYNMYCWLKTEKFTKKGNQKLKNFIKIKKHVLKQYEIITKGMAQNMDKQPMWGIKIYIYIVQIWMFKKKGKL